MDGARLGAGRAGTPNATVLPPPEAPAQPAPGVRRGGVVREGRRWGAGRGGPANATVWPPPEALAKPGTLRLRNPATGAGKVRLIVAMLSLLNAAENLRHRGAKQWDRPR